MRAPRRLGPVAAAARRADTLAYVLACLVALAANGWFLALLRP